MASSLSSKSSSSSGCCSSMFCSGCPQFTLWNFSNLHDYNSDGCDLYIAIDVIGSYQQISVYKDNLRTQLVALGQRIVYWGTGYISLDERSGSGLTGTVAWNGVPVYAPNYHILSCSPYSSSSTSSSIDSSSSSSDSSLSSSSSSSNCCLYPDCSGVACSHFSFWTLNGNKKSNTDRCSLYLDFDYISSQQHIGVYKNVSRSVLSMVAEGQGNAGLITLYQKNSSGLTGSVVWDGTPIYYPSTSILDCEFSSSSSSSSTSSSSSSSNSSSSTSSISSSSSSSLSNSSSSGSSSSSLSSSSTSNSSSESSSSLDSSSSSSESEGNVSTSSSSSFGGWNKTKPLILGLSAINASGVLNRLAQTISISTETYSIGKVFCYFYGPFGTNSSYTIHLDVYSCDDSGQPQTILASQTMPGSNVTGNGWYSFNVGIEGNTPSNKYISFVIWQDNGDEDNYVLWGYYYADATDTKAFLSNDGGLTWQFESGVLRAIKIISAYNAYDLTNYRIVTPPADEECITQNISSGGIFDGTKLVHGEYQYGVSKVVIDNPSVISSFVVDSSGSMGWNDRFSSRQEFIADFIQKMKENYPSQVLFDMVKFGSQRANTNSITSGIGTAESIHLDLTSPNRVSYSFVIEPSTASIGDIYSNNSYSFVVSNDIISGTILTCTGSADASPFNSGSLDRISGAGDLVINYLSVAKAEISNGIVAYGFKNLEEGHGCNIADVEIAGYTPDISLINWQPLTSGGSVPLSIGNNGPKNSSSLDFISHADLVLRRPTTAINLPTTKIVNNASIGDSLVDVENASVFNIGDAVDFVDKNLASMGHTISNVVSNTLIVTPPLVFNIFSWNNGGGIAQKSNLNNSITLRDINASVQFKDPLTSKSITFFLQTVNGLSLEWDISPFKDWYINNLYWLGETAIFPISIYDTEGNPFPDGTKVILYVGGYPDDSTLDQIPSQNLTQDAPIGSVKLYIVSTEGYQINDKIDILDNLGQVQTVTIVEVGDDYIKIDPALQFNFTVVGGSKIVKSTTVVEEINASSEISGAVLLPSFLGMVDVTPIYTGKSLDPSLLKPYDITPVLPSATYEELNLDSVHIQSGISDIPTISGYGVIRIMAVTEDNLKTVNEKNAEAARLIRTQSPDDFSSQLQQNEEDPSSVANDVSNAFGEVTTTTTTLPLSHGDDYDIDNPVYLIGGEAESSMTSYATKMDPKVFDGANIPGSNFSSVVLLVKEYEIYPSMVIESDKHAILAKQYFEPFPVYFTPPINIYSTYVGDQVGFWVLDMQNDPCTVLRGYNQAFMNGVYATGNGFKFNYIVTNENKLVRSESLRIRVYSNTSIDLSGVAQQYAAHKESYLQGFSRNDLNITLPKTSEVINGTTVISQPLTDISSWREAVENNPSSRPLESLDTSTDPISDSDRESYIQRARRLLTDAGYKESKPPTTTPVVFEYYTNPWQWTNATQYGILQDVTIPIVNGKASFELPSSDVSALVMVQASVYFGQDHIYESIRSDIIAVANPIDIGSVSPLKIRAEGGDITYEIGVPVTWKGQPISDNVVVSFAPDSTSALPAVSKTDNGWAGGVFLGPHYIVTMHECDSLEDCSPYGDFEDINITVSHLGFTTTLARKIEWTGDCVEDEVDKNAEFYFSVVPSASSASADGFSKFNMRSDLNDTENELWIEVYSQDPVDGKNRDRMQGYEQDVNNTPNPIKAYTDLVKTQSQTSWITPVVDFSFSGLNENIGYFQVVETSEKNPFKEIKPWIFNVNINSRYKYVNKNNEPSSKFGIGVTAYPYFIPALFGDPILVIPYPQIQFSEPLGVSVQIESYNGEFIRNGIDSPNIVAEVTWEDGLITNKFTKNKGQMDETTIEFPFPVVTFEAGICKEDNAKSAGEGKPPEMKDTRNLSSGCLTVGSHPDISLSDYSVVASLSRTDIYVGNSSSHTHACTVDSDGDGTTDSTIILSGTSIADHTHVISGYKAIASGEPIHDHGLRCVAITQLQPLINPTVSVTVNAYAVYDPTSCKPYGTTATTARPGPSKSTKFPTGNRMMFATLYLNNEIRNREIIFNFLVEGSPYTARSVTETDKCLNLVAEIKTSSYSLEDYPGHWIIIPEAPVPDGTRVIFDIDTYKPLPAEDVSDVLIIRPDSVREYIYIRVNVSVYMDGFTGFAQKIIVMRSNLQWIPSVRGLLFEPTNDDIYLSQAISQIETIGASQIHDAVKMAAQRLIQFQTDNLNLKESKKVIFLLTDGDENSSQYSIDQAIDNVNFIDGKCKVPVIPIKLGYSYSSDAIIMDKYASQTCGNRFYLINPDSDGVLSLVNDVVSGGYLEINNGVYTNTIDLFSINLPSSISLGNFSLPSDSLALFRYRFSSDAIVWSSWSEWYDSSVTKDFEKDLRFKGRYFQYQVHLYGNDNFESPELYSGMTLCYYKAQTFTTFFQPIDLSINTDEYLSSIHITHKAKIPPTSTINYGYAQFNSTDISDYASTTRPWIIPDRHTIILSRYNELFLTKDYQKYTAINGGWPELATIEVYKVNNITPQGEMVSPTDYAVNNKTGMITFYNIQNVTDRFVLCVYFDPVFRILCNVVNYGPDPVIIDHIGLMYNVNKRIPMDKSGNIIHTPINERL